MKPDGGMPQIDRQATFSGTKEVAAPLAIDVGRLQAFLAARRPDLTGEILVRQLKGGQSNPTYLLEVAGYLFVLRRKPPGKLLPSAHAVDRALRVISALHAQRFPVAEPVLYCEDAGIAGTAFYIMGFAVLDWELSTLGDPLADLAYHLFAREAGAQ
jgi:aminoglycoside phosphotransferase (APT) family kinase protein